jgi:hypothetical protein
MEGSGGIKEAAQPWSAGEDEGLTPGTSDLLAAIQATAEARRRVMAIAE